MTVGGNPSAQLFWDWDGRMVTSEPYVYTAGTGWNTNPANGSVWTSSRYNGNGLRVQKADGSGTFNFLTDGSGPGSQVLTDGTATYTDGLSVRVQ